MSIYGVKSLINIFMTTLALSCEFGYNPTSGKVNIFDIQATIIHLLSFHHEEFTNDFQGRPFRLTYIEGGEIKEGLA